MVRKILFGVAGALVVLAVVVATRPSGYRVERRLEISAPPEAVFGVLNDLRQLAGVLVVFGDPFEQADPGMQKTVEGPTAGVGQSYAWAGEEAGKGKMTIKESVPAQKVGIQFDFAEPMESTASHALTVAGAPKGSLVTWSMEGKHNFVGKAFGLFVDLDGMLGDDLEKSLARLKTVAEKQAPSAPAAAAQVDPDDAKAATEPGR